MYFIMAMDWKSSASPTWSFGTWPYFMVFFSSAQVARSTATSSKGMPDNTNARRTFSPAPSTPKYVNLKGPVALTSDTGLPIFFFLL